MVRHDLTLSPIRLEFSHLKTTSRYYYYFLNLTIFANAFLHITTIAFSTLFDLP